MSDQQSVRIYLAGDSTVQTYQADKAPQAGWGQYIAEYFTGEVEFINRAIGGRSSKSFVEEGRLDGILNEIRPGDYLFIQMGHNDSTVSKPERYTDPFTDYKRFLKMYINGARTRGAIPLLITPVGRLHCEEGIFLNDFQDYCTAMKEVAAEMEVLLIDGMERSLEEYASIGYDEAYKLFMISSNGTDCTHFTEQGGDRIARILSQGVKDLGVHLSSYVR